MDKPQEQNPSETEQNTSKNSEQPNLPTKVIVYKGDKDKPTIAEWMLIVITFILAVFNVFIIIYASNQVGAAIDTVKVARDQFNYQRTQDSIYAIRQTKRDSIQNTKDSLFAESQRQRDSLSNKSFRLENRAYIIFHNFAPVAFNFGGGITTIPILIKNVGRTPAQRMMHYTYLSYDEDSIKNYVHSGEKFIERHKSEGVSLGGDGDSTYIIFHNKFTKKDSIFFVTNKPKIYIGGIVSYYDIFGIRHLTYFCIERIYGLSEMRGYKKYNEVN